MRDPFIAAAIAARRFHVVGNASETVSKRADSIVCILSFTARAYMLHGVNRRPPIQVWVTYGTVHYGPRSGRRACLAGCITS